MKKLLFLVFLNIFCAVHEQDSLDEIPKFKTRDSAVVWIYSNIEYKLRDNLNNWQSPEETMRLKSGVCSDYSILLMYIFKTQFGDDPKMHFVYITMVKQNHAIVESNGILYDPANIKISYEYIDVFSFDYEIVQSYSAL